MLLKSKICFTTLVIYEIIAVSMLHFQRICDAIFPTAFCDSWYRYFLFCVVVPLIVLLVLMWVREIIRAHRRRTFIKRAKSTVSNIMANLRGKISDHLDMQDIEKLIAAAILIGIKRYVHKHPDLGKKIKGLVNLSDNEYEFTVMSADTKSTTAKKRTKTPTKKNDMKKKK